MTDHYDNMREVCCLASEMHYLARIAEKMESTAGTMASTGRELYLHNRAQVYHDLLYKAQQRLVALVGEDNANRP